MRCWTSNIFWDIKKYQCIDFKESTLTSKNCGKGPASHAPMPFVTAFSQRTRLEHWARCYCVRNTAKAFWKELMHVSGWRSHTAFRRINWTPSRDSEDVGWRPRAWLTWLFRSTYSHLKIAGALKIVVKQIREVIGKWLQVWTHHRSFRKLC